MPVGPRPLSPGELPAADPAAPGQRRDGAEDGPVGIGSHKVARRLGSSELLPWNYSRENTRHGVDCRESPTALLSGSTLLHRAENGVVDDGIIVGAPG